MGKSLYCQDKSGVTQDVELPLAGLGSSAYPVCDKSPLPLIRQGRKVYPVGQKVFISSSSIRPRFHTSGTLHVEGGGGERRIIIIIYYSHQVQPSTVRLARKRRSCRARWMPRPRGRSTVALTINPRRRKRRTAGRRPCGRPATLAPEPLGSITDSLFILPSTMNDTPELTPISMTTELVRGSRTGPS
jgi:hypothetical protein